MPTQTKLFVLDTNVLMHDPTALFRFEEHDVFLPMVVLEELDAAKKGLSEVSRNVRQVSRFLDQLISTSDSQTMMSDGLELDALASSGINIHAGESSEPQHYGRLFFQSQAVSGVVQTTLPGNKPDNQILSIASQLQQQRQDRHVVVVSKDINLRIKAAVLSIPAEDYHNDRVLDDVNLLFSGTREVDVSLWQEQGDDLRSWKDYGKQYYELHSEKVADWHPRECLTIESPDGKAPLEAIVQHVDTSSKKAEIVVAKDYRSSHNVWGINARNDEQNFALNLLMDYQIDFVSLVGAAGTGKTLLALASALAQTMDETRYREIIMTRVTVPLAEDIGFLPGTEEEKMTPWMGALMDNLEVLTEGGEGGSWGQQATNDLLGNRIKIRSVNFMRGRTFLDRFIIIDEAQNLTPKQMKAMITRAGPGTKIVCLGNVAQIDTPYLTETSSGLTYAVNQFRPWPHSGHLTLTRGERSRLADFANTAL